MSKGFTLMEVLVSVFIIGVLSAVILLNYRVGQEQAVLTRVAAAFETEIRKAQNLAVASIDFGGTNPCGYGIHYIDNRTYSIYVGLSGGAANCRASNHSFQSGIDLVYQVLNITEPRVVFGVGSNFTDIFFEPPDPTIYIGFGGVSDSSPGRFESLQFCLEDNPNVCKRFTIDTAGRITIQ